MMRWQRFREWMLFDLVKERAKIPESIGIAFGLTVSVLAWATMLGAAYGLGWLRPISWMWGQ